MFSINKIMYKLNSFLTLLIILLFTGCSQTDMKEFQNNTPKLDLFNFFEGKTIAYGIFEDRFGNLKRQFRVNINGKIKIDNRHHSFSQQHSCNTYSDHHPPQCTLTTRVIV